MIPLLPRSSKKMTQTHWVLLFINILLWAPLAPAAEKNVALVRSQIRVPETDLLDIGILVFEPGATAGLSADIRRAEALYIPNLLASTLQSTGFWGAVRIVPDSHGSDVVITGAIRSSTSERLEIEVRVVDARGKQWLEKRYKDEANIAIYNQRAPEDDPYQALYHRVANEILKKRRKLKPEEEVRIREVSQMRFAADLAPEPFARYLRVDRKGLATLERLPAEEDTMMARVETIRARDRMFIDKVNEYYASFADQMREPYLRWRSQSYWEIRSADYRNANTTTGGFGGIFGGVNGSHGVWPGRYRPCGPRCQDPDIPAWEPPEVSSEDALNDLGASLVADVTPLRIEVEGKVLQLTGTVQAQYAAWRKMLREIFAAETGLPLVSPASMNGAGRLGTEFRSARYHPHLRYKRFSCIGCFSTVFPPYSVTVIRKQG